MPIDQRPNIPSCLPRVLHAIVRALASTRTAKFAGFPRTNKVSRCFSQLQTSTRNRERERVREEREGEQMESYGTRARASNNNLRPIYVRFLPSPRTLGGSTISQSSGTRFPLSRGETPRLSRSYAYTYAYTYAYAGSARSLVFAIIHGEDFRNEDERWGRVPGGGKAAGNVRRV